MKDDIETQTPWTDATHVDFKTFRENASRKVEARGIRVYEDIDGHEIFEQEFSDGSRVLMHSAQYNAMTLAVARSPYAQACILYLAGEGPDPGPKPEPEVAVNG